MGSSQLYVYLTIKYLYVSGFGIDLSILVKFVVPRVITLKVVNGYSIEVQLVILSLKGVEVSKDSLQGKSGLDRSALES